MDQNSYNVYLLLQELLWVIFEVLKFITNLEFFLSI